MTVRFNFNENEKKLNISVVGDFTHKMQREFRASYEKYEKEPKEVIVNLANASYVDSTAIGMLLVMSDKFKVHNTKLIIINANPNVKSLLQLARIDTLYQVK